MLLLLFYYVFHVLLVMLVIPVFPAFREILEPCSLSLFSYSVYSTFNGCFIDFSTALYRKEYSLENFLELLTL